VRQSSCSSCFQQSMRSPPHYSSWVSVNVVQTFAWRHRSNPLAFCLQEKGLRPGAEIQEVQRVGAAVVLVAHQAVVLPNIQKVSVVGAAVVVVVCR